MCSPTAIGLLLLGAVSLCAAGPCKPKPSSLLLSTSVLTSEAGTVTETDATSTTFEILLATTSITTTTEEASTSTIDPTVDTTIDTTIGTTTETIMTISESETFTESSLIASTEASTETSVVTTDATIDTTSAVTEAATASTKTESTTTTAAAEPPIQTVEIARNGGFDDSATDITPWTAIGATSRSGVLDEQQQDGPYCYATGHSPDDNPNAKIHGVCQRVPVDQGYEYTLSAWIKQRCIVHNGQDDARDCSDTSNEVFVNVDGVGGLSRIKIPNDNQYHQFRTTLQYYDPSIEDTDFCVSVEVREGDDYLFFIDTISFARGRQLGPNPDE
ncbi:hypothetical protein FSARC_12915, partial [Fusarium sarcochroum]